MSIRTGDVTLIEGILIFTRNTCLLWVGSALAGVWTRWPAEVPSNPYQSVWNSVTPFCDSYNYLIIGWQKLTPNFPWTSLFYKIAWFQYFCPGLEHTDGPQWPTPAWPATQPTDLLPLRPGAQFQLSPQQLVSARATPQECQSQALALATSPAVIYCAPWMNLTPGSSPHPVWRLLTVHGTCHCHRCGLTPMLRDCTFWWDPLRLGCPLLPVHPPLWNCLYQALVIVIMPKTLLNEIPIWRAKHQGRKIGRLCGQFKRKWSCTFNMQVREQLWHL